jgi:hypothetical protein
MRQIFTKNLTKWRTKVSFPFDLEKQIMVKIIDNRGIERKRTGV